jgi:hypothetical protein
VSSGKPAKGFRAGTAQAESTAATATHPNEEPLESSENRCMGGHRCLRSGSGTEQSTNRGLLGQSPWIQGSPCVWRVDRWKRRQLLGSRFQYGKPDGDLSTKAACLPQRVRRLSFCVRKPWGSMTSFIRGIRCTAADRQGKHPSMCSCFASTSVAELVCQPR